MGVCQDKIQGHSSSFQGLNFSIQGLFECGKINLLTCKFNVRITLLGTCVKSKLTQSSDSGFNFKDILTKKLKFKEFPGFENKVKNLSRFKEITELYRCAVTVKELGKELLYIAKNCWLLRLECSVHVSNGFKKKNWMVGGWGELYPIFLGFWKFFNCAKPLNLTR